MERLQKFLSRAGVASRRHAETLIVDGRVKVNGKVVTVLGTQVDAQKDLVLLDNKLVSVNPERRYFLFYKPPGVVTTLSDPEGRPTVGDYAQDAGGRVFPVGRLDYDAEGALLLTDDGDLANKLMHPSHQVPRVYLAKVKGEPDEASLQKLLDGVRLEDGMAKALQARIFERAQRNTWVKLVVTEGRQHLVKRLCAAIGHPVVRLYRPAHAGISVHGLKPGELRALSNDEIRRVKAAAEGDQQPEPPLTLPARRHGHAAPGFEPEEDEPETRPEGRRPQQGEEAAAGARATASGPERQAPRDEAPRAERLRFSKPERSVGEERARGGKPGRGGGEERSRIGRPERGGGEERPRFGKPERGGGEERPRFGKPERGGGEGRPRFSRPAHGGDERPRSGRDHHEGRPERQQFAKDERGDRPRFGRREQPDREGRPAPHEKPRLDKTERPRFGTERKRFGDPERAGPLQRVEGAFGHKRARGERAEPVSRPFPGEPGSGKARREDRPERKDGPRFGQRAGADRGGRRFGGDDAGRGPRRGPPGKAGPRSRGGPAARSSQRKPRGSW